MREHIILLYGLVASSAFASVHLSRRGSICVARTAPAGSARPPTALRAAPARSVPLSGPVHAIPLLITTYDGATDEADSSRVTFFKTSADEDKAINFNQKPAHLLADVVRTGRNCGEWKSPEYAGVKLDAAAFLRRLETHLAASGKKHVMFYAHGFSIDPTTAIQDATDIMTELDDVLCVPIIWPTDKTLLDWDTFDVARRGGLAEDYVQDRQINSKYAAAVLHELFTGLEVAPTFPVSLLTHSMGNHVLRQMAEMESHAVRNDLSKARLPFKFDHIFMVAGDVALDVFSLVPGKYICDMASENVHVLYNNRDMALDVRLAAARILPTLPFNLGWRWSGDNAMFKPLGLDGPDHSRGFMVGPGVPGISMEKPAKLLEITDVAFRHGGGGGHEYHTQPAACEYYEKFLSSSKN